MQALSLRRRHAGLALALGALSALAQAQFDPSKVVAEPEAIARQFTAPEQAFTTPGFAPGRLDLTTHAEVFGFLDALAARSDRIVVDTVGRSQQGRAMALAVLSGPRGVDARLPTVLLLAQQHGNEPAGGEAALVLAQSLATDRSSWLDRVNVLIMPRANPDAAERFMRETANRIDLNRDHLLLRTPEAQAIAGLMRDYAPAVVVDAHEYPAIAPYLDKFGGVARADVLLQYAMAPNVHEFVSRAAEEWFRRPLLERLQREGLTSDWYHTLATAPDDRRVAMGAPRPDLGRNAAGLRHAVSLLVETRGSELGRTHFARRVHTQVVAMESVLASAAARADDLAKLRRFVETETVAQACSGETVVEAASTPSEYLLKLIDPASGADMAVNVAWESALQLQTLRARARPCGYWLAAGERDAALRLRGLGLTVQRIEEQGVVRGESYRETSRAAVADSPGALQPQVETVPALLDVAPGSWYVPLDQPLAGLAIAALEPDTPVSYVTQGVIGGGVHAVSRVLARPGFRLGTLP